MSATTTPFPTAVIFDAYGTLFDVHSVIAAAEQMFPGHGDALSQLWRQKQIEYTQLRTLADAADAPGAHYRPFWDITLDALRFAAKKLQLTLGRAAEKRLMDEYACLSAFPDAVPALRMLREPAASPRRRTHRRTANPPTARRSRDPVERQSADARHRAQKRGHEAACSTTFSPSTPCAPTNPRPPLMRSARKPSTRRRARSSSCRRTAGTWRARHGSASPLSGSTGKTLRSKNSASRRMARAAA